MKDCLSSIFVLGLCCSFSLVYGTNYYIHPKLGQDSNSGQSKQQAFQSLERASQINFLPGDQLLLASGEIHSGELKLLNQHGSKDNPITITSVAWKKEDDLPPALINFKSQPNGILLDGSSFIQVSNIQLRGNGYREEVEKDYKMRCGVLITNSKEDGAREIVLENLHVFDVFYENKGFIRGKNEVKTANGTQRYGWGIRIINKAPKALIKDITIENCLVKNVSHTGIKLTGKLKNIQDILISGNEVLETGGPGIQMSGVQNVHVIHNSVQYSGSNNDSRKWGRGSGLWTWGSSHVLIEKNSFMYAKGPADSAGAHIDFNCDNIILQYNLSGYNAGGFCEVLGNTYNCAYRYNVSINDGYRQKGKEGAFQEGKTLWLSGYQGKAKKRKGPVNFYFYNNTIYCDSSVISKIAIDKTSKGILIANNIFYLKGGAKAVLGDQYKPDSKKQGLVENVVFQNNLFLNPSCWPDNIGLKDTNPVFGDPQFAKAGGRTIQDYRPNSTSLIAGRGIPIDLLPGDTVGLWKDVKTHKDILGHPSRPMPSIGVLEVGR